MEYRNAQVFKKYGLDFCCGGKKTLKEACSENNIALDAVEIELNLIKLKPAVNFNYNDWELEFLIDFIINNHHKYVKKSLEPLLELAHKVANVHGARNANLITIANLFKEVADEMSAHMMKEEHDVFPYLRSLVQKQKNTHFTTVQDPVNILEMEHEAVGDKMAMINNLCNNYQLPVGACASYSLLFQWLKEFEDDLHLHVHLENNILFPKASAHEQNVNLRSAGKW